MSWRDQLVARILLMLARLVCDDPALSAEIKGLGTHIQVYASKHDPAATPEVPS